MNIILLDNTLSNNLSIKINNLLLENVDTINKKVLISKQTNISSYNIVNSKIFINDTPSLTLPITS
jgi:predicted nucleic acid-binding protein